MYPLCLRYAYVIRPLHSLSICFFRYASALKLSPITSVDRVVILLYPLSSAKLPMLICLNPMLQTTLVRFLFHFVLANFRQFCRFLERMKTDDANPETFVLFAYALCSSISGTGPLRH